MKKKSHVKILFDTSIKLYSLLTERIYVPIYKEKRLDNIYIKPMLFLCVRILILIQFAYTPQKVRTVRSKCVQLNKRKKLPASRKSVTVSVTECAITF